ncbi:Transmembrane protein 120 [Chionoecetes opilio]|uniref:Transmembrane protein 120 n=1 Tax=Chionoecetes opilio TaxID=41210 RepID=A0A8J5CEL3_CHIOP|nr:Transmembrane protein 120 [Chionoecetes opilio]
MNCSCLLCPVAYSYYSRPDTITLSRQAGITLLLAISVTLIILIVIYSLTNVAYFAVLTPDEVLFSPAVAVTFGREAFGVMMWSVPVFVAISTIASLNGKALTQSRVVFVGARQGQLPASLALVGKNCTPVTAIMFMAVIGLLYLVTVDIFALINVVSFSSTLSQVVVISGLLWLRYKQPHWDRPFKVWTVVAVGYLLLLIALVLLPLLAEPVTVGITIAIIFLALVAYFLFLYRPITSEDYLRGSRECCATIAVIAATPFTDNDKEGEEVGSRGRWGCRGQWWGGCGGAGRKGGAVGGAVDSGGEDVISCEAGGEPRASQPLLLPAMDHIDIDSCIEEWETLSNEYRALEKIHKEYGKKLEELTQLQTKCMKGIAHQRYRINVIKQSLKKLDHTDSADDSERNELLQTDLIRRKAQLYDMENSIPKQNGLYLKIILGNINVSILNKEEKTADLLHMFLLVWYYCTLTIRESILKVNGSRIKGWWRAHHFISTVLSGILLIWPNGETYYAFRRQFMLFNIYISFVQYLLFMYQRGCLYRLKALGEKHNMDITVEGFHFWMWRGLGFIIPFLLIGYMWELYNAYTLYLLSFTDKAEWHVITLAALFFLLFLGNTLTTLSVIPQKLKERMKFKYRFTRLDKYHLDSQEAPSLLQVGSSGEGVRGIIIRKGNNTSSECPAALLNPESPQRRTPAARAASFSRKRAEVKEEEEAQVTMPEQERVVNIKNVSDGDGEDGANLNEILNDITKDIDFEKVDQENEDEQGLEDMTNEDRDMSNEDKDMSNEDKDMSNEDHETGEKDEKQENTTEEETKKEK